MPVFVNRTLNMKKIKVIGFDMDYTLVRYNTDRFEDLTHSLSCQKLVQKFDYPEAIRELVFDAERSIGGLVVDRRRGNLLKLSRYGKVKVSYHGLERIDFREQSRIYQDRTIDLSTPEYRSLDTAFAISNGVLFSQLVELKKEGMNLPDYAQISDDVDGAIDMVHQDGSLKQHIRNDFENLVIPDPEVAWTLERYKAAGKKLMIITNSDFLYTRDLLDYALNPYWKNHKRWQDVFDVVITLANKPRFFEGPHRFLKIENEQGLMSNYDGPVDKGIYQGGWFGKLQQDLQVPGSRILYLGDHIYGDVVSIKKWCNWRTALVLEDLERELDGLAKVRPVQRQITALMAEKGELEKELNQLDILRYEKKPFSKDNLDKLLTRIDDLNHQISDLLNQYREYFNPYWGEVLRAGSEESRFADQMERYACIYMTRVSDLFDYSPRTYFRPDRRLMPHELEL